MKKIWVILLVLILQLIVQSPSFAIKIGLVDAANSVTIGSSVPAYVINGNTNRSLYSLAKMTPYEFRVYHNSIAIKVNGSYYDLKSNFVTIKPVYTGFVSVKGKWYRGHFIIYNRHGVLTVINKVDIEDYIKGVVPSEMPSSWLMEAHKAQAIAARSYALANLGKRASHGYDLKDTPEDQAYGGASAERANTNSAVDSTREIVLVYNLKIIPAYYSASAGGQTTTAGAVWSHNLPYLQSVPSYDDNIKKSGHGVGMSQHGANNLAKSGYNAYQILQYFYKGVQFARINPSFYQ